MRSAAVIPTLALTLTCFLPMKAVTQDYATWIRYSDSRDNPLIVEMIQQGDLGAALDIAAAVGLREDVEIQEIILAVGETIDPRPQWEREVILRALLAAVFPRDAEDSELERRLEINREAIGFLVVNLAQYSLSLKREIIRLLGFHHPAESLSVLMSEGRWLAELLHNQQGQLNGEQAGLTLTYLETVGRVANPAFADIVLLMLERSRHLEVADSARSVSRSLLLIE